MRGQAGPPQGWRNHKLVLEYDGAGFHGFQRQPHHLSVQEALESALSRLCDQPVKIGSAAGRTDAGVHALGQVVHVFLPRPLKPVQILRGLNSCLPPTAAVRRVRRMPARFHARFHARCKLYEYRIWNDPVRPPLERARTWHVPYPLDLAAMRCGAKMLTGRHDFRSFCTLDPHRPKEDTVRTLYRLQVSSAGPLIRIRAEADGFLYRMVRNLVGTLIELGRGKLKTEDLRAILRARNRKAAGETAPAQGLCLIRVTY